MSKKNENISLFFKTVALTILGFIIAAIGYFAVGFLK